MKKLFFTLMTCVLALGIFVGCNDSGSSQSQSEARTIEEIQASGKIIIGVFSDKKPFGYVDANGEYQGYDVYFQTGTDEHGEKIELKAKEEGITPQEFVDEKASEIRRIWDIMNTSYDKFVRTTDKEHEKVVQHIFKYMYDKGDIYLGKYEGWYCDGCERFVTEKEYEENNGICPDHQRPYEKLIEENYYLRIADFKDEIRNAILSDKMLILPEFRKNEVLKLLARNARYTHDEIAVMLDTTKENVENAVKELKNVCSTLKASGNADNINIDFSVVSDISYYNGITFRGFIENVPGSILSGGRYDNLLTKLGKNSGAVGFAVYMDLLSFLNKDSDRLDTDVLLVYGKDVSAKEVFAKVNELQNQGNRVCSNLNEVTMKMKIV